MLNLLIKFHNQVVQNMINTFEDVMVVDNIKKDIKNAKTIYG